MVRLDEGRKGEGKGVHACHGLARQGQEKPWECTVASDVSASAGVLAI